MAIRVEVAGHPPMEFPDNTDQGIIDMKVREITQGDDGFLKQPQQMAAQSGGLPVIDVVSNYGRGIAAGGIDMLGALQESLRNKPTLPGWYGGAQSLAKELPAPESIRQAVDQNLIGLQPQAPGTGFRAGQSVGRAVATAPITAAAGGVPALAADIGLTALSGPVAELVEQETNSALAGDLAELGVHLTPTLWQATIRGLFRGSSPATLADEMADRAITGVDTGVATATLGRTTPQTLQSYAEKTPGGQGRMGRFFDSVVENVQSAINRASSTLSKSTDPLTAGARIKRGVRRYGVRVQDRAKSLYNKVWDQVSQDSVVTLTNLKNVLDDMGGAATGVESLDALASTPAIKVAAQGLEEGTQITIAQASRLRSMIGARLANPSMVDDIPRAELKRLYAALSDDIDTTLQAASGEALALKRQADRYWRREMTAMDDVLDRIAEKVPAEKLLQTVQRSPRTLAMLRKSLNPDEFDIVVAETFRQMGLARASAQNAAGDAFSLSTFLTEWNKLGEPARKVLLAGDRYKQMRETMNALARQASRAREASRATINASNTGRAVAQIGTGVGVSGGLALGAIAGSWELLTAVIAGVAGANVTSRLMTDPRFVDFLAQATKLPIERLPAMAGRLNSLVQMGGYDPEESAALGAMALQLDGIDK